MNASHGSLETIAEILETMGLDVTHQHEDMVFVSQNFFVLRFTKQAETFNIYFSEEIEEEKAQVLMGQLEALGELHELVMKYRGAYTLSENEDETLSIEFFDLADG